MISDRQIGGTSNFIPLSALCLFDILISLHTPTFRVPRLSGTLGLGIWWPVSRQDEQVGKGFAGRQSK